MAPGSGNASAVRADEKEAPFRPGDRVAILGLGRSGTAAARLVAARGGEVYASDRVAGESQVAAAESLEAEGIDAEAGGHDVERVVAADLVIVSPGIGPATEIRRAVREAGVRTLAEIEVAWRFLESRTVAITGTNGKTTTTALCGHLLERAGLDAVTAGNIGRALSDLALEEDQPDWVVLEVSSFQLADIDRFRPDIGVLLNLAPDHLDRYRNVDSYYEDKARLFENGTPESRWVLNADDDEVLRLAHGAVGERYLFSAEGALEEGAYVDEAGDMRLEIPGRSERWCGVGDLRLVGRHNVADALAAGLAGALTGCEGPDIGAGLTTFRALPHRLQPVARGPGDVLWVNDSKATNVSATSVALRAFDRPLVLLMGGRGKGEPYGSLVPLLEDHVRALVAFGESAPQIVAELGQAVPEVRVEAGMEGVVQAASELARPGDVVLFSPACASFDMFRDYEARGEAFVEAVRCRIEGGGEGPA
ncbi:MAG TPA: UDP-N-acetylmuramoyl-L-alanine--D-glutamate ligase [Gemmatimonadota bacterium]|nr:UDP-N-acetylmuramoyl-L-alanine--D-glutamate ligase [Gemmatimonadota bacterium]